MGDWLETGKSFGGDIKAVLRDIRERGFEPAIWVAPFVASPQSKLFREHPDWFIKDADGKPLRSDKVGFGGWRLGPWYALDGTHPEAQRFLEHTFRVMREEWGCTYFKLDANYWGTLHRGHFQRSQGDAHRGLPPRDGGRAAGRRQRVHPGLQSSLVALARARRRFAQFHGYFARHGPPSATSAGRTCCAAGKTAGSGGTTRIASCSPRAG